MAQRHHCEAFRHPDSCGSLGPTVPEGVEADACDSQSSASKGEVASPVSFSESGNARQYQPLFWKLF